jgi:pimeloyl-ACP methyl ester carboxylesterase
VQPTLAWIAQDLKLVLETAKVAPPYVLVGQSYGGDIARQCMLDWPAELIAGMVVVDSPSKRAA